MHGHQRVLRLRAQRLGEGDLFFRRGARGVDVGRAEIRDQLLAPAYRPPPAGRPRSPRRSAPASTSPANRRRESRRETPSAPCLRARPDRESQNTNAPDTAHSPGSAAFSNTKVSDGSSRMVRNSFTCAAPSPPDRTRRAWPGAAATSCRSTSALPMRRISRSPFSSMSRRTPFSARQPLQIAARHRAEAVLLPGIDRDHEMAREALHHLIGHGVGEAFLLQRGDQRVQARLVAAHRHGADHGAEHQPGRRFVLARRLAARPGGRRPPGR